MSYVPQVDYMALCSRRRYGHNPKWLCPLCPEWLRIRLEKGHNKKGYVPNHPF